MALPAGITITKVKRYLKLDKAIKTFSDEHKALGDEIKAATTKGTYVAGDVILDRTEADNVDTKGLASQYPFDLFPEYYKFVIDVKAIPEYMKKPFTSKTQRLSVKQVTSD